MSDVPDLRSVPSCDRRQMTREESGTFIQASMAGSAGKDAPKSASDLVREFDSGPLAVRIMVRRLALGEPELRFSPMTVLFLCSLCETPAKVVQWAHYLVQRSYEVAPAVVDTGVLAEDFPWGFPTEEGMSALWDLQKRSDAPCGNALDGAEPWRRPVATEAA